MKLKSEIHFLDKLRLHYLEIAHDDLIRLNNGKTDGLFNQRVIISLGVVNWQAGIVALGEGRGYITVSQKRMKEAGIHAGEKVTFELEPDDSEFGHPVPEELTEVMRQDDVARERFEQLKPGMQRYIIYYVIQVKSSVKRIERSWMLMNNLKRFPVETVTFRQLLGKEDKI